MEDDREYTFDTFIGTCTVNREKLVLNITGKNERQRVARISAFRSTIIEIRIMLLLLCLAALGCGIWQIVDGILWLGILLCVASLILSLFYFTWSRFSPTQVIDRSELRSVMFSNPRTPGINPCITITFMRNDKWNNLAIYLPVGYARDDEKYMEVKNIFADTGWYQD